MDLMMYIGNDLIESVPLTRADLETGYVGNQTLSQTEVQRAYPAKS